MQRYLRAFDALLSSDTSPGPDRKPESSDGSQQASGILDELLRVHEYERQRLGQELHDTAGQLVVALQLSVAHLRSVDADGTHDGMFEEIQDTVRRIDRELRSLAFLHYPVELGDRSLRAALQGLALGFDRRTGIHTSFKCEGETSDADRSVAIALLRVAQEALVNVHRHARASAARVAVERHGDEIRLTVSDNGVGLPKGDLAKSSPGIGLRGMRHRVESLGGRFRISNLKRGAKVFASIPLAALNLERGAKSSKANAGSRRLAVTPG